MVGQTEALARLDLGFVVSVSNKLSCERCFVTEIFSLKLLCHAEAHRLKTVPTLKSHHQQLASAVLRFADAIPTFAP